MMMMIIIQQEDLAKQPKRPRAAMKVDASNFNDDG